jgi:hypothetical protein
MVHTAAEQALLPEQYRLMLKIYKPFWPLLFNFAGRKV